MINLDKYIIERIPNVFEDKYVTCHDGVIYKMEFQNNILNFIVDLDRTMNDELDDLRKIYPLLLNYKFEGAKDFKIECSDFDTGKEIKSLETDNIYVFFENMKKIHKRKNWYLDLVNLFEKGNEAVVSFSTNKKQYLIKFTFEKSWFDSFETYGTLHNRIYLRKLKKRK